MTQEQENIAWEGLLKKYGAYELERKLQRREMVRLYNRKWPYDQTTSKVSDDVLAWTAEDVPTAEELAIADQDRELLLEALTPAQREIAELLEMGFKPRDIAARRGDKGSGAVRWQKHNIKDRLLEVV